MVVLQPNPKYIVYLFTTNVILKKNACTLKSIIHGWLASVIHLIVTVFYNAVLCLL